ncbi:hypothetical protein D3C73_1396210 [compost metagenome]
MNITRTIVVIKKLETRPMIIADKILTSSGINKEAINGSISPRLNIPIKTNPIKRNDVSGSDAFNSILYCPFAWISVIIKNSFYLTFLSL